MVKGKCALCPMGGAGDALGGYKVMCVVFIVFIVCAYCCIFAVFALWYSVFTGYV